jgi:hypothetical protein
VNIELATIEKNRNANIAQTESPGFGNDARHGSAVLKTTIDANIIANASEARSLSATEVRNRVRTSVLSGGSVVEVGEGMALGARPRTPA